MTKLTFDTRKIMGSLQTFAHQWHVPQRWIRWACWGQFLPCFLCVWVLILSSYMSPICNLVVISGCFRIIFFYANIALQWRKEQNEVFSEVTLRGINIMCIQTCQRNPSIYYFILWSSVHSHLENKWNRCNSSTVDTCMYDLIYLSLRKDRFTV